MADSLLQRCIIPHSTCKETFAALQRAVETHLSQPLTPSLDQPGAGERGNRGAGWVLPGGGAPTSSGAGIPRCREQGFGSAGFSRAGAAQSVVKQGSTKCSLVRRRCTLQTLVCSHCTFAAGSGGRRRGRLKSVGGC